MTRPPPSPAPQISPDFSTLPESQLSGGMGRRLAAVAALAMILLLAAAALWALLGKSNLAARKTFASGVSSPWVVSGASMVPTLMGPSVPAHCTRCRLDCRVEAAAIDADSARILCSHCGQPLQLDRPAASENQTLVDADIVVVDARRSAELPARGKLVAATRDRSPRFVKRLIGLPGDVIDVHEDGMHLTLNGRRIEDALVETAGRFPLPQFLVDNDDSREQSRWASLGNETGRSWKRDAKRQWHSNDDDDGEWLVYSHVSVYDQNRPSQVLDDYQYNVTLTRKLQPVDRFLLAGRCECSGRAQLEVAFWSADQVSIVSREVPDGEQFVASIHDASPASGLPVTDLQPVAIRVSGESVVLASLQVYRLVEYRLRPRDNRSHYPLRVDAGEAFVLGDNVPVSVDSRDFGCLAIDDVIGTVSKATP